MILRSVSSNRDLVIEPGSGMRPIIPGGAGGNVQERGRLFNGQASEIPQLYEVGLNLVMSSEFIERVIDREKLVVDAGGGEIQLLNIQLHLPATVTHGAFATSPVDEDAAHRLSGSRKKMGTACELRVFIAHQTHPGFMHEGRGLQCVSRGFVRHL